jgi:hypothetical protein
MKARLDEKVDKLRSQTMSFSNEGIQVRFTKHNNLQVMAFIFKLLCY